MLKFNLCYHSQKRFVVSLDKLAMFMEPDIK